MIFDHMDHIGRYSIPFKEKIMAYLKGKDPRGIADGDYAIDGRDLFVQVRTYAPQPASENKFEAHRVYADLQYVADGIELMQTAPADRLKALGEYDRQGDYQFFQSDDFINDHIVRPGQFMVFFPHEAHRPSCLYQNYTGQVKKMVFKIRI